MNYKQLLTELEPIARLAGEAIMEVYHAGAVGTAKSDGSPVTLADQLAEAIILAGLAKCANEIAVVSEENTESHLMAPPEQYFLVDPLDGTREFLKADGKGAFTVNIALIEAGEPVLGVVFAPALNRMFSGAVSIGAFENGQEISGARDVDDHPVALVSVSHMDHETKEWLEKHKISRTRSIGSSLKFGLLANGQADLYPRFGPTMEWDTAAGHAVLSAAGGRVEHPDGTLFTYGKPEFRNGPFIAHAR